MGYKINVYSGSSWVNLLDHDLLANLQGGTTGEYYHLTADQESYIDQDVTSGSSPTFVNTNMTGNVSVWTNDADYVSESDVILQVFNQATPSATWVINHNFGSKYIMTQVFDGADKEIRPTSLELTDVNNVTLTFDEAITGYCLYSKVSSLSPGVATGDHGSLTGLDGDDHIIYSLADGSRAFTNPVAGENPTIDAHLTTKYYVDNKNWLSTDISDFAAAVSANANVAANTAHRTSDGSSHSFIDQDVTVGSSPQLDSTNMYGPVSAFTNDEGYITSDSVEQLNAQSSEPSAMAANDLWVEIT